MPSECQRRARCPRRRPTQGARAGAGGTSARGPWPGGRGTCLARRRLRSDQVPRASMDRCSTIPGASTDSLGFMAHPRQPTLGGGLVMDAAREEARFILRDEWRYAAESLMSRRRGGRTAVLPLGISALSMPPSVSRGVAIPKEVQGTERNRKTRARVVRVLATSMQLGQAQWR